MAGLIVAVVFQVNCGQPEPFGFHCSHTHADELMSFFFIIINYTHTHTHSDTDVERRTIIVPCAIECNPAEAKICFHVYVGGQRRDFPPSSDFSLLPCRTSKQTKYLPQLGDIPWHSPCLLRPGTNGEFRIPSDRFPLSDVEVFNFNCNLIC